MILIVDDDQTIRLSIGLMLRQAGFEYEAVASEADAMTAMRRGNVDLAILDMNLTLSTTGQQGIEMLRKFRILAPNTPIILLSAWATVPLAVEGMKYGAVDFVTKPWANRDFMTKIRKALETAEKAKDSDKVQSLDTTERHAIEKALRQSDGNLTSAAQLLGITRQSLYRRMEKFGLK